MLIRYNVNPLVRKHLHLRNAFVTSVLNVQLSCLAITFIVLVMQATQTPLELAMAAYEAQQHIPEEDRSSLRTVATDYGVLPGTLSKRLRGLTTSRSQAYNHLQALSNDEEASLIDYIRRSSLLGHPPPPYMVYETDDAIRRNRGSPWGTCPYRIPQFLVLLLQDRILCSLAFHGSYKRSDAILDR